MQSYTVSTDYYFKEIGQKVKAGSEIELREGDAAQYMMSHPGLLTVARMTTNGQPFLIRKMGDGPESTATTEAGEPEKAVVDQPATEEVPAESALTANVVPSAPIVESPVL